MTSDRAACCGGVGRAGTARALLFVPPRLATNAVSIMQILSQSGLMPQFGAGRAQPFGFTQVLSAERPTDPARVLASADGPAQPAVAWSRQCKGPAPNREVCCRSWQGRQRRHYHRRMKEARALNFRLAGVADVAAVVALVESAYRGDSGRRGWTTESDLLDGHRTDVEAVAALVQQPDDCVLLAETAGRLISSCHVQRQGEWGYFGMFAVDPLQQGAGVGKQVLAEAERIVREHWHCCGMRMTVIEQRPELLTWYERRGYRATGEYEAFPYGNERFGIPRRDDLRFAVLTRQFSEEAVWTVGYE